MAPCNGTTTTPPKLVVALRPPTIAHYNGTLQWRHDHSTKIGHHPPPPNYSTLQWHPAMAPRPLHQNCPQPYHPTMAPCNGTTTTPPKLVVTLRPPTIAHYNGTLQWHHDHSTKIGRHPPPPNYSTLQWHPAMAPRPLHQNWSSPSAPQL